MKRIGARIMVVLVSCVVMGCGAEQRAWEDASEAGTQAAYEAFLDRYPSGDHAGDATERIRTITAEAEWVIAEAAGTLDSYRQFVSNNAEGPLHALALERISSLEGDEYVVVPVDCVVAHSGYEGIVVAPAVSKPVKGIVVGFSCNEQEVEIVSDAFVDGCFETAEFRDICVRFRSMVSTVGAGDFTGVPPGVSVRKWAVEVLVRRSVDEAFRSRFSK